MQPYKFQFTTTDDLLASRLKSNAKADNRSVAGYLRNLVIEDEIRQSRKRLAAVASEPLDPANLAVEHADRQAGIQDGDSKEQIRAKLHKAVSDLIASNKLAFVNDHRAT